MNSSTRITRSEVVDLCETIHAASSDLPAFGARVLGLYLCVRLTLTYLRHNLPQGLLAEVYGVSQATASRVITAYTPLIARALEVSAPTVEDLDPTVQLIVDGTLLQCWFSAGPGPTTPSCTPASTDRRSERPGRLHPHGPPGVGVRPTRRKGPRHRGPTPLRTA